MKFHSNNDNDGLMQFEIVFITSPRTSCRCSGSKLVCCDRRRSVATAALSCTRTESTAVSAAADTASASATLPATQGVAVASPPLQSRRNRTFHRSVASITDVLSHPSAGTSCHSLDSTYLQVLQHPTRHTSVNCRR